MKKRLISAIVLGTVSGALSLCPLPAHAMPLGGPYDRPDFGAQIMNTAISTAPAEVTVRSGDTLSGIGTSVGRTWEQLAGWNHLANPDLILAGQVLKVPAASYSPPSLPVPAVPQTVALTATTPATPAISRPAAPVASSGGWSQPWACIAEGVAGGAAYGNGESGGNPAENTGNGYEGGLQFAPSTWSNNAPKVGVYVAHAYEASIGQQEAVAAYVLAHSSWESQWPRTSKACGYW